MQFFFDIEFWKFLAEILIGPSIVGLAVGYALVLIGKNTTDRHLQSDAIRDLMAYRGDYASPSFRQAVNKVSIIFHEDAATRKEIRELYDEINNPTSPEVTKRKIVSLIYNLCQKNGYKNISEYDIDQSFPEANQTPSGEDVPQSIPSAQISATGSQAPAQAPPTP
jgi:hypothetical protein